MGTSAAFAQYPSPCSQRAPEIRAAQAAVRSEIPGQRRFRCLRPRSSHRDLSQRPIRACLRSLAWNADTGGSAGCTLPPCGPCAASPRQCHRGRCSSRWRLEAGARRAAHWRRCGGVVNERGGMALRMDMGGGEGMGAMGGQLRRVLRSAGDGARRVRVAQQAEVLGSRRRARGAMKAAWTTGTLAALAARSGDAARRAAHSGGGACRVDDVPGVLGSGRVLFVGEALGARGRDKGGADDGEQPLRAQRTQEVVKVVPGITAGAGVGRWRQCTAEELRRAGRRRGDMDCAERQHRMQRVARVGLGFTPAWYRA
ncbi:hypothetical protein B0H14DRAFT_3156504 [Mycena olivaceomarginata]|nr:hypothetical protein B0H14DRAFT_3156504 [Mycena olivaceomarginata]